ncbi:GNAT family N-acetyltransferase [Oceanirhabdus sp. W0125-5]|uniref:GNAT family N-acetyltransferase n=1 Tax=Oceanirhabdus sp. W0125-5 TaxID=2999116 RepID=UPI0022F2AD3B|nr:GNAT family N-acetyltransferase [Oceanirhabdus sp. W0125-5]WBW94883.1 GNAT family N-acetyltransferase [Oceanirhabdus sp. W0125-5]
MNLEIEKVHTKDEEVFRNLFQLFAYDFSEMMGMDVLDNGKYPELSDMDDYYSKDNYISYFIKVDGKLAGVAVLRFDDDSNYFRHFFIMRKYRRRKLGKNSVYKIFKTHPGKWRVSAFDYNKPAINFWKNVFDVYTEGEFIQQRRSDDKGVEFAFKNIQD